MRHGGYGVKVNTLDCDSGDSGSSPDNHPGTLVVLSPAPRLYIAAHASKLVGGHGGCKPPVLSNYWEFDSLCWHCASSCGPSTGPPKAGCPVRFRIEAPWDMSRWISGFRLQPGRRGFDSHMSLVEARRLQSGTRAGLLNVLAGGKLGEA